MIKHLVGPAGDDGAPQNRTARPETILPAKNPEQIHFASMTSRFKLQNGRRKEE